MCTTAIATKTVTTFMSYGISTIISTINIGQGYRMEGRLPSYTDGYLFHQLSDAALWEGMKLKFQSLVGCEASTCRKNWLAGD